MAANAPLRYFLAIFLSLQIDADKRDMVCGFSSGCFKSKESA